MIDKRYFICEICGKVFTPASTCASISSPPWGETINWPKLVLIVAPVSIRKTRDGEHWWSNKKVFKCVLMLFPLSSMNKLFTWAFLLC